MSLSLQTYLPHSYSLNCLITSILSTKACNILSKVNNVFHTLQKSLPLNSLPHHHSYTVFFYHVFSHICVPS